MWYVLAGTGIVLASCALISILYIIYVFPDDKDPYGHK